MKDPEKGADTKEIKAPVTDVTYVDPQVGSVEDEVSRARTIQNGIAPLRYLRRGEEWLDEKLGIETQGIDRIPEEAKRPPHIINSFFMWWSMTCHVGTLPIGFLGPEFGLSLGQSVAAIVVGTLLGAMCTAYTGTLGPKVSNVVSVQEIVVNRLEHSSASAPSPRQDTPSVSGAPNCVLSSMS